MAEEKEPFYVHCGKCSHEWAVAFLPLPVNVFAKLANALCPMCRNKEVLMGRLPLLTEEGDARGWIANGDTGISSETIWHALTGYPVRHTGLPSDPSDFGRCYRLLKVMPSWRSRLPEVSAKFPEWQPLISAWDECTALYEEELPTGSCPKLYARMRELRR